MVSRAYSGNIMCTRLEDLNPMPEEIFMNVTEDLFPGIFPYYKVSNMGRVFNKYTRNFIGGNSLTNSGYFHVNLSGNPNRNIDIQRLVLVVFNPVPGWENLDVNHIDGNKSNNCLSNLEWVTRSENQIHAYNTGLHARGENASFSKYTDEQVTRICELLQTGKYMNQQIADIVGVPLHLVGDIKNNNWAHISSKYTFQYREYRKLTVEDVEHLCQYFQDNPKPKDMHNKNYVTQALMYFNLPIDDKTIDATRHIYDKRYYKNIICKYNF